MSAHLKFLEKISSITGELAVFKESVTAAVVRVEKITIEPDMLSFTLKAQSGGYGSPRNLETFTVSSCFEYLNHSHGLYTSSIVNWVLETDPVKVIYLSNLIKENTSVDVVLSAMRERHAFCDDNTSKVLRGLVRLKNQINNGKLFLASDSEFKGQSWGGAGVMIISNDEATQREYLHFDGFTVISEYALQIGELFRRVRRIVATSPKYNYLSKYEFWGELAEAANSLHRASDGVKLQAVCEKIIMQAINFVR